MRRGRLGGGGGVRVGAGRGGGPFFWCELIDGWLVFGLCLLD